MAKRPTHTSYSVEDLKGGSCTPRPPIGNTEMRARENAHKRILAWRKQQSSTQAADPRLSPWLLNAVAQRVTNVGLLNYGVDVVPIGFPAGTRPEDLPNYPQIVRAFSRTFDPILFAELTLSDPFPTGEPYWSNFFFQISPNTNPPLMRLNVNNTGGGLCLGVDGQYQAGGIMSISDCTPEEDVFHEIGHAVMDDRIMKKRSPLYFHYGVGGATPAGGQPNVIDAKDWLNKWFGQKLDSGTDVVDGVSIGFVSKYAETKKGEDFAETFKYYVYFPTTLFAKIDRQSQSGSRTLSMKAGLIAQLYAGLYFNDGGVPAGWPGYMI